MFSPWRASLVALAAFAVLYVFAAAALAQGEYPTADVALVLAADASGSVDNREIKVQRDGYAAAITHPDVVAAIADGPHGRILVAYFEWSGCTDQKVRVGWTVIDGEDSARAFAARLVGGDRLVTAGSTCVSGALRFADALLIAAPEVAERRVIDISGDGTEIAGFATVGAVRDAITARGVTINAMPILVDPDGSPDGLRLFYETSVIGGPASFIEPAKDFHDIGPALRRKLVQEIG
jgi:hypothetical protein